MWERAVRFNPVRKKYLYVRLERDQWIEDRTAQRRQCSHRARRSAARRPVAAAKFARTVLHGEHHCRDAQPDDSNEAKRMVDGEVQPVHTMANAIPARSRDGRSGLFSRVKGGDTKHASPKHRGTFESSAELPQRLEIVDGVRAVERCGCTSLNRRERRTAQLRCTSAAQRPRHEDGIPISRQVISLSSIAGGARRG